MVVLVAVSSSRVPSTISTLYGSHTTINGLTGPVECCWSFAFLVTKQTSSRAGAFIFRSRYIFRLIGKRYAGIGWEVKHSGVWVVFLFNATIGPKSVSHIDWVKVIKIRDKLIANRDDRSGW